MGCKTNKNIGLNQLFENILYFCVKLESFMKLIIDAGSTKMEWVILEGNSVKERFCTDGFNPNYSPIQDLMILVETRFIASSNIASIYYYGTGCASEHSCLLIKEVFKQYFPKADIHVTHDLMAACHALFGHEKGIACILGTGSNSCVYDGERIVEQAVSLGYLLGDEGSGMHIGREVLRHYFYHLMPDDLSQKFDQAYHLTRDELIENLYHKEQPSRYMASFAEFAGKNQVQPYIHNLIKNCFTEFVEAFVCRYGSFKSMKISFVGSVAYHFRNVLEETISNFGLTMGEVMSSPTEGLLRYYQS